MTPVLVPADAFLGLSWEQVIGIVVVLIILGVIFGGWGRWRR